MEIVARRRTLATLTAAALLTGTAFASPLAATAAEATGTITGTVTSDVIAWGEGWVSAYRVGDGDELVDGGAAIEADGTYALSGLAAGEYRLAFTDTNERSDEFVHRQEWWNDELTYGAADTVVVVPGETTAGVDADLETVKGKAAFPTVSGVPAVGRKLTVTPGVWPAGTEVYYEWYTDGLEDAVSTSSSFTPTAAHRGQRVSVVVLGAVDAFGRPSDDQWQYKWSLETAEIAAGTLTAPTPAISGSAVAGATLTAKAGTWTKGTSLSYQWYAAGKAVSGATKSTYKPTAGVAGKALTVKVTGKKAGYATVAKTSKATAKVARAATPVIAGTAQVGKKLTAKPGTWTSGTTFSYQWYANGKAIAKATKSAYTVASAIKGKSVTVKVTGKKSGHTTVAKTSKATAKVKAATPVTAGVKKPSGKAAPISRDNCPSSHPIKGNQTTRHTSDWIYHVPGGQFYKATDPEECFATASAARQAGYRASQR